MTIGIIKDLKRTKDILEKVFEMKKTQKQENALIVSIINHLGRRYIYVAPSK